MTVYTVDVAKFTAPVTGEPVGTVDICVDDERFVHIRMNNGRDETVMRLHRDQARRVRNILDMAIDGLVEMHRS
jgi:hypothetical protein